MSRENMDLVRALAEAFQRREYERGGVQHSRRQGRAVAPTRGLDADGSIGYGV
jgi:hypothetical protein